MFENSLKDITAVYEPSYNFGPMKLKLPTDVIDHLNEVCDDENSYFQDYSPYLAGKIRNGKQMGIKVDYLNPEIINFHALQNLSLFDNNLEGEIPGGLEKLHNLTELNLSHNKFKGTVSKNLAVLDVLNMTMLDENGNPVLLEINTEKETTIVTQN